MKKWKDYQHYLVKLELIMYKKYEGFRHNMTDEEFELYLKSLEEEKINPKDEYSNLFEKTDWEKWDRLEKLDKWISWDDYLKVIEPKQCKHFGEVNIFGLIPITCHKLTTEKILNLIKEKNIKNWLILDIDCILNLEVDKFDIKFYFEPITDLHVPSFES